MGLVIGQFEEIKGKFEDILLHYEGEKKIPGANMTKLRSHNICLTIYIYIYIYIQSA